MHRYILNKDKVAIPASREEFSEFFEDMSKRRVGWDEVGPYDVSTVFLGLDHSFGQGRPVLYETIIFQRGQSSDLWCERCSTWEEAEAMHQRGKDEAERMMRE